jgi:hypothetical protein
MSYESLCDFAKHRRFLLCCRADLADPNECDSNAGYHNERKKNQDDAEADTCGIQPLLQNCQTTVEITTLFLV